jgi:NADH-quinone oxidoreductase subunit H
MLSVFLVVSGIIIKILLVVGATEGAVAYLIYVERKVAAFAQDRIGPNRCGREFGIPFGLLQALADGAKMLLKEDVVPSYVNKPLYFLAPMIAIVMATIGFAVIPFGPVGVSAPGLPGGYRVDFQIAPYIDIGIVYVFAIGSLAVYGVILAGWASNNKYSFIGGLRSSAQLISYEIPLGLSIMGTVLIAGSLDLNDIINWQDRHVWGMGAVVAPVGFLIFLVSAFAETNRLPFDLPESEQELIGGFHTEYSAMKFGMFFLGEYLHVITVSFLTVILFFGGWSLPFGLLSQQHTGLIAWIFAFLKLIVIVTKVALMILFMMWVRWTLPRFRYDQLMDLAWKSLIPLAIVNLVATAAIVQWVRG